MYVNISGQNKSEIPHTPSSCLAAIIYLVMDTQLLKHLTNTVLVRVALQRPNLACHHIQ